jgi:hypothetical protein
MKCSKVVRAVGKILMVVVASACVDGTTDPTERRLVAGDSPSRYESVWEDGIEYVEVDGKWYPTAATAQAQIAEAQTKIIAPDYYGDYVAISAYHTGEGSGTLQTITFDIPLIGVHQVVPLSGWSYKNYIGQFRMVANHTTGVSGVPKCGVRITASTFHEAWFGTKVTATVTGRNTDGTVAISFSKETGTWGWKPATSAATPVERPACPPSPSDECGPLTSLRPTNPFALAAADRALPSPTASFECAPQPGQEAGGGYDGGLCHCQQWFLVVRGQVVDEWWDCYDEGGNPVDSCRIS